MSDLNKYGIGFWIGAIVIGLVNMFQNLKGASQSSILNYNYLMIGISLFGLILNIILLKIKGGKRK